MTISKRLCAVRMASQQFEHIRLAKLDISDSVGLAIHPRNPQGGFRTVHSLHAFAARRQMQREPSGRSEAIQRPAASVAGRRDVILPLVKKNPGLLSVQQVGVQLQPVHLDCHYLGNFARHHARLQRQRFPLANRYVVTLRNTLRREQFLQTTYDVGLGTIHALIQRLEGEIVAIPVDHQARQLVAFAMHQAVSLESATTRFR